MLKRVSIQNFKSLKDVTLDLQKVNLLIGPNNSGKTNFLKALEYFQHRIDLQPYSFEDFDRLQYKYRKDYEIKVELTKPLVNGTFIHASVFNNPHFKDSTITYCQSEDVDQANRITHTVYRLGDNFANTENLTDKSFHFADMKAFVGDVRIYRLEPSAIANLNELNPDEYVYDNASNLTSFILNLGQNNRQVLDEIETQLAESVGDIIGVASPTVKTNNGAKLRLRLFDRSGNDFWADEVSEGVLYFLALLCIIHQPNPPKLLLLEEPEKGIHPRRIEEVINFIFGLVDDKDVQVIMTTHSPAVVDMFKDMPESVFIFDKDEEGATHVKNLQKDIIEPETEESERLGIDPPQYLNGLGEAWKVGFIGGVPR
ncbi:MAG: AAA family ATPase [Bacteroidetes bacterium]|nr:AAA family ATPase [Fibrella sp.]